jgi:hypothetical protein
MLPEEIYDTLPKSRKVTLRTWHSGSKRETKDERVDHMREVGIKLSDPFRR